MYCVMTDIKTILVTTDFSDTSEQAFEPALTLSDKFGARIILTHVEADLDVLVVPEHMAVNLDLDSIRVHQMEKTKTMLAEQVDRWFAGKAEVVTEALRGTPHVEIVRLAKERGADLIVMATHGRGFISHAILGSTTERVVRRAPCAVLVIRPPGSVGADS